MQNPDSHDLHKLRLLDHVEKTPRLTHRSAAKVMGVSIKLAHDLLSGMVERGLLHVKKHHARRWDYFLTTKGLTEKARLTMEFIDFSMHFYREARKFSAQLCRDLAESNRLKVDFLGTGDLAEITYLGVQEWGLELQHVYDDQATTFLGRQVESTSKLSENTSDAVIVCLYDRKHPMLAGYLPESIPPSPNMVWIFKAATENRSNSSGS